jgi:hypothetical protein
LFDVRGEVADAGLALIGASRGTLEPCVHTARSFSVDRVTPRSYPRALLPEWRCGGVAAPVRDADVTSGGVTFRPESRA